MSPRTALTLWPEWAWAITSGTGWPSHLTPKLVENRSWRPGARLPVGSTLAIHAGMNLGGRPGDLVAREAVGAVIGMFRRANPDVLRPHDGWTRDIQECQRSAIVALATIDGYDQEQRTGWDVPGAWHWRLRDVVVLRSPVLCRGAQGLWTIPEDVRVQIAREVPA